MTGRRFWNRAPRCPARSCSRSTRGRRSAVNKAENSENCFCRRVTETQRTAFTAENAENAENYFLSRSTRRTRRPSHLRNGFDRRHLFKGLTQPADRGRSRELFPPKTAVLGVLCVLCGKKQFSAFSAVKAVLCVSVTLRQKQFSAFSASSRPL